MSHHSQPLISIITPSFNAGQFLEQSIESVIGQDYPYIEHIIIDGGSTDNTLQILNRYQANVTWISEPDRAQGDALNKGFKLAKGDIIGWLNADDFYQPGAFTAAVDYLQNHPAVELVYGNFNLIDATGRVSHSHRTVPFSLEGLLHAAIIPQTSMFFRRGVLDDIGGVDESLHYVLDWEFTLRIALRRQVARVGEVWGNFRLVEGTKSVAQPEKFWPEAIQVLKKLDQPMMPGREDAQFMAHLLAGLEFARAGRLAQAKSYVDCAFEFSPVPRKHPAVLASGLHKTAAFPWHTAFATHPKAEQTLDNLSQCLNGSGEQGRILGFLHLLRALKSLRQGQWTEFRRRVSQAAETLKGRDFLDWRSARMMLAAVVKA
jgi:hypothetical protein